MKKLLLKLAARFRGRTGDTTKPAASDESSSKESRCGSSRCMANCMSSYCVTSLGLSHPQCPYIPPYDRDRFST